MSAVMTVRVSRSSAVVMTGLLSMRAGGTRGGRYAVSRNAVSVSVRRVPVWKATLHYRELVGAENFFSGLSAGEQHRLEMILEITHGWGRHLYPSLREMENYDAVLWYWAKI